MFSAASEMPNVVDRYRERGILICDKNALLRNLQQSVIAFGENCSVAGTHLKHQKLVGRKVG